MCHPCLDHPSDLYHQELQPAQVTQVIRLDQEDLVHLEDQEVRHSSVAIDHLLPLDPDLRPHHSHHDPLYHLELTHGYYEGSCTKCVKQIQA